MCEEQAVLGTIKIEVNSNSEAMNIFMHSGYKHERKFILVLHWFSPWEVETERFVRKKRGTEHLFFQFSKYAPFETLSKPWHLNYNLVKNIFNSMNWIKASAFFS